MKRTARICRRWSLSSGLVGADRGSARLVRLHAVARTEPRWRSRVVRGANGLAGEAHAEVEGRGRHRLRHAARGRQPDLSVLAAGRQRGDERARRRQREGDLADRLPGLVHDAPRGDQARAGTEVDAGLRERQAVLDRHDRRRHGVRRRHRQAALAEAGLDAPAHVQQPRVFSARRWRAGDFPHGRAHAGRAHGLRCEYGRREVELGR